MEDYYLKKIENLPGFEEKVFIPNDKTIFYRFISNDNISDIIKLEEILSKGFFPEKSKNFLSEKSFRRRTFEKNDDVIIEEYVSILFSSKENDIERIESCISYLHSKRMPFNNDFGFVSFDSFELIEKISYDLKEDPDYGCIYITIEDSTVNKINDFIGKKFDFAVHFGLNYMEGDQCSEDVLETKIIELLRKEFYLIKKKGTNKYPGYFFLPKEDERPIASISKIKPD